MKLIGIAGTNGSGKDTVGRILKEKYGWMFISVSDLLRDECRKRGLEVNRENLRAISAEWRREGGLGVLVDKAVELFRAVSGAYAGLAISSLRNPGETARVRELGGINVWVDANPRIRYERIQAAERGRGGEDDKTYEEFLAEQEAEMKTSGDAATLDMASVRADTDVQILNEADLTALESSVADLLTKSSI